MVATIRGTLERKAYAVDKSKKLSDIFPSFGAAHATRRIMKLEISSKKLGTAAFCKA